MKIFPTASIKQLDAYIIENEPVASIALMERAAVALADAITKRWEDKATPFTLFAGPGNNGGDALALARLLMQRGYIKVTAYLFNTSGNLSPDCQANMERLAKVPDVDFHVVTTQFVPPVLTENHVVIDGLFGSGLNKPLKGGFAAVVKYINASAATVVAIDVPSGLMGEDNTYNVQSGIIRASLTLSLQFPKLAFFFAENQSFVGEWQLLDIGISEDAIEQTDTDYHLLENEDMPYLVKLRARFAHKGDFGSALLIAGSQGMAGASVLAARACLRSGVGLLTVHVPFCNNFIVQTSVPEAKTELDISDTCFTAPADTDDYQAVGIGPGLGRAVETESALLEQIDLCQTPMVVDADALNILGEKRSYIGRLPKGSILTPHSKELERLVGKCQNSYDRLMKARELAKTAGVYIILKGAYSAIISPSGKCWFNITGNPGMATGGSGDVLTGVLLALLAQGYETEIAVRLGTYVHGLAGDIACKKQGTTAMTAGDIVNALPMAWRMLEG
ncbi:NAD(P)H-hydrate dehydratase [Bacteroides helcogenes]|uniref:Bifunctional NAD(P)H-hydrate repair enzyme n=1 Tax=Bacteroides helcogenes (strain ATCC 35417 / DSM 20613 / JCM 6297 / CCUG 15421 / P 36-108) TaxID=693979 RepID=E6SV53_BACT6|nr:NAD(P)H-hydrate dehydratase [Bacteroides helcogenes]ADV43435.1 carbohydrate kinase, YjeF related protein [Bacteroides helcogenes P 36-108]MDY5238202.1 NAD(P)H-hydrate dehydratase [Bacteroides helcogenes]